MENEQHTHKPFLPLYFAFVLIAGVFIGREMMPSSKSSSFLPSLRSRSSNKISETIDFLKREYVDTVNEKQLTEEAISSMLQKLDPHSFYIPASELQSINESLEGNFDGIGVEFNIHEDTIMVVTPVSGGPSEHLGILPGDRIVKIEGENVGGIGISNKQVMQKLRGPSGTKVNVSILRRGHSQLIPFTITRGKIPIYSVDAAYMVNSSVGYIKINRFAETTYEEYKAAFDKLKQQGLTKLILDLRNNPGGYLKAATMIADEFLEKGKLIVYTEGRTHPKNTYKASRDGDFETGKLVILIDEGSASASEIVSGAIQDWDRGTIVGRRSFGKGLVQDQTTLPDSSAIRLTIARYYTPSGRCIQKPYNLESRDEYNHELDKRIEKGELQSADSITFPDSLKFKTLTKGRTVYGGGGIMPDIFVPLDTSLNSRFLAETLNAGLVLEFAYDYADKNRSQLMKYKNADEFRSKFSITDDIYNSFLQFSLKSIKVRDDQGAKKSSPYIRTQLKALIARSVWKGEGYYPVVNDADRAFKKAVEIISEGN